MSLRLLVHQLRSDTASLWPLHLAWWLLLVYSLLVRFTAPRLRLDPTVSLLPTYQWPLVALIAGTVVLQHRFEEPDAFWRTRPIPRRLLLLAKSLQVAVLTIAPALAIQLLALEQVGSPPALALETLGALVLAALAGAVIAGACRTAALMILCCLLLPAGFLILSDPLLSSGLPQPFPMGGLVTVAAGTLALALSLRYLAGRGWFLSFAGCGLLLTGIAELYQRPWVLPRLHAEVEVVPVAAPAPFRAGSLGELAVKVNLDSRGASPITLAAVSLAIERPDGDLIMAERGLLRLTTVNSATPFFILDESPPASARHQPVVLRFRVQGQSTGPERRLELPLGEAGSPSRIDQRFLRSIRKSTKELVIEIEERWVGGAQSRMRGKAIVHPEHGKLGIPRSVRSRLRPTPLPFTPPHSSRYRETMVLPLRYSMTRTDLRTGTQSYLVEEASWSGRPGAPVTLEQLEEAVLVITEQATTGRFERVVRFEHRFEDPLAGDRATADPPNSDRHREEDRP